MDLPAVLRGVDIPAGSRLAVVGRTGSRKSSLTAALIRMDYGVCVGGVGSSSARRWTRARGHAIAIARVTGFALALGLVIPGLDNAGHVGGMTSGALCGWVGAKNSAT